MPRTWVPALIACTTLPFASISASMRRWPSIRVIGSTTMRCPAMHQSLRLSATSSSRLATVLFQLVALPPWSSGLPASGAARIDGLHASRLDLMLLDLEGLVPQWLRPLDEGNPATAAAAPVRLSGIFRLVQIDTERLQMARGAAVAPPRRDSWQASCRSRSARPCSRGCGRLPGHPQAAR